MSAASARPSAGARYVLEKAEEGPLAVIYRGFVHLPDADVPMEVRVELPGGATSARAAGAEAAALEKTAAALVRAATKGGGALPRKIVRWRG